MTTWTPNNLNQYTSVERKRTFDVTGRRASGAEIAVNGQAVGTGTSSYQPTSSGLYYHMEASNLPTPQAADDTMEPVSVTQRLTPGATPTVISPPGALQWVGLSGELTVEQRPSLRRRWESPLRWPLDDDVGWGEPPREAGASGMDPADRRFHGSGKSAGDSAQRASGGDD